MQKEDLFKRVLDFFRGDVDRTWEWFETSIPYFGKTPLELIKKHQHKKLIYYIDKFMK